MTESRVSASPAWSAWLAFGAAAAGLSVLAALVMFSAFMFYDDEGYVLMSLRNFVEHGRLYREVFSQYGPFPYVFYDGLHLLGMPITHTTGRSITLLAWSGSAIACALLVWQSTRSFRAQISVLVVVFLYLWVMASEPSHPGGLIAVITAVLACWGYRQLGQERVKAWAWLAGIGVAALTLTKINIGGLAALSAFAWFLLYHESGRVRQWAPRLVMAGVIVLPLALMRPLLNAEWVQTYAILFACSGFAAVGAASLGTSPRAGWGTLGSGILGAGLAAVVILGVTLLRGSSPMDILDGVLLRPLRHPVHFNLDFPWKPGARWFAMTSAGVFAATWICRRRGKPGTDLLVAILRVVVALTAAAIVTRFPAASPDNFTLTFLTPWLWVFLWPLANESDSAIAARRWVGLLFLGQSLHSFPVRGSQIAWGTFLLLPVIAMGAWSAAEWLGQRFSPARRRNARLALHAAVLLFTLTSVLGLWQVSARYQDGRDLKLPGGETIRLPEKATALFRLLTVNAAAHGDVLFSLPGMFSLNLWSGLPPPTLLNVTHWFSLLDEPQQQQIIRALAAHPRACVVVQREHVSFIQRHGFGPFGPLQEYIRENFTPAFSLDDFEFCVRKGRTIGPLLLAEKFVRPTPAPDGVRDPENTLLQFTALLPADRAVESVEIVYMDDRRLPPLVLRGTNVRIAITPVNLAGEPIGPEEPRTFPLSFRGMARVSFYLDAQGRRLPPGQTLIVLRDADGNDVALVRLRP